MTSEDRLGQALRRTLLEAAADVGAPPELAGRAAARGRVRRRRTVLVAAVSLLLVVTGAAVVLAGPPTHRGADRLVPAETPAPSPPPAPGPGQQAVSYHGLQVFVPSSWPLNAAQCGTPVRNTVLIAEGGGTASCYRTPVPGLTVMNLLGGDTPGGRQYAALATEETTVDGQPARRGRGRVVRGSPVVAVLLVPSMEAVVVVESPDGTDAGLLAGVHLAPIDAFGCLAHLDSVAAPVPQREEARATLLPPGADSVVGCRYRQGWLMRSGRYSAAQVRELEALAAAAPQDPQGPRKGSSCDDAMPHGLVLRAHYPDGPDLQLSALFAGCPWELSNGAVSKGLTQKLVWLLTQPPVGYDQAGNIPGLPVG